jgi:hypothetical protein
MLPKPGKDHTSQLNYRPINLLNSLGKRFEKIILKRLNFQLRELKVIRNEQYGFKKGQSTTYALLRNVERITHGFNYNKATVMLFLDTERAFDKVWTTRLIAKLSKAKIPPHLIHAITNTFNIEHSLLRIEILIQAYTPFRQEYLRVAHWDPHSSIFILMAFHILQTTQM